MIVRWGCIIFGSDKNEENEVVTRTISGGVTINDLLVHATQEGLPFGGVGASGYGGFIMALKGLKTSHMRSRFIVKRRLRKRSK